jgi:hypothetical protein
MTGTTRHGAGLLSGVRSEQFAGKSLNFVCLFHRALIFGGWG